MQAFPGEVELDELGVNPYTPAGHLTTGLPLIHRGARDQQRFPDSPEYGQPDGPA